MSDDRWGGDLIPAAPGRVNLVAALSAATDLPYEALDEALSRPAAIAAAVLEAAGRLGTGAEPSDGEANLLFWGVHVLAQHRDKRLFGPLLAICRMGDEALPDLVVSLAETTLPKLVTSVFDDDPATLEAALTDRQADEAVRMVLFGAYGFLAADGLIPRGRAHDFLVRFDEDRLARGGDLAWIGWASAIALLGFRDLADRRAAAIADARLIADELDEEEFASVLAKAEAGDPSRFGLLSLGYLDDAVGELEASLPGDEEDESEPVEPARNPLRNVGRNDPCPCGSGRKFKKCCLEAA